ncbi:MAG TPA: class I SAM-dependent methyltransferase [Acidimicrobiales bacterium]|nr:class I SAM-dependent methyltransferase [Acidimicrobiales bacterium]
MSDNQRADGLPGPVRPRHPEDFDGLYSGTPPWDIGRPQPAFVQLADGGLVTGRVLDVGCGTGEHTLMAAGLGLQALGVDVAPTAIGIAERKARDRGLSARFMVANALELGSLAEQFDTVLDCGLFHIFEDDDRARYVDSLGTVIPPGGRYHMLCFSDRQPGDWGPRRVTEQEITASFRHGWTINSIAATKLDLTISADGAHAWLARITRTPPKP